MIRREDARETTSTSPGRAESIMAMRWPLRQQIVQAHHLPHRAPVPARSEQATLRCARLQHYRVPLPVVLSAVPGLR